MVSKIKNTDYLFVNPQDEDTIYNESDFFLKRNHWFFGAPNYFDIYCDRVTLWARTQGVTALLSKSGGTTVVSINFKEIKKVEIVKHPLFGSFSVIIICDHLNLLVENIFSPSGLILASGMNYTSAVKLQETLLKIKSGDLPKVTFHPGEETIERRLINSVRFSNTIFDIVFFTGKVMFIIITLLFFIIVSYYLILRK